MSRHRSFLRSAFACASVAAMAFVTAPGASAQGAWKPDRPVTVVVPYSPGGGTDALARHVAKELARLWGQNVVVENTPGADGLIGSRRVIDARPDGYTLLVQLPSLTLNRHLPGFKGGDPAAQLIPISIFASLSGVVVVNSAIGGNTLPEVVRYCRTAAQPCSYGTTENIARLQGQMLAVDLPSMVVVNYKGGGQLITDLVGNSVNMALMGYTAVIPYQQSGKLRIVMTAGRKRSPVLPDVPTAAESGYPQLEAETWYGLFAPLGTPQPVIDGVAAAVRDAVKEESYLKSIAVLGATAVGNTPAEFAARVREDSERFGELVRRFPIQ
jgi:tripartite-type tricarboxylate transporter receptor subunit TctC